MATAARQPVAAATNISGLSKDKLQNKFEELQTELENRNVTIRSIQRNYENLSVALQTARREHEQLTLQLGLERETSLDLVRKLDKATTRADVAERAYAELKAKVAGFDDLQKENDQLKRQKALTDSRLVGLTTSTADQEAQIKSLKGELAMMKQSLKSTRSGESRAADTVNELRAQLEEARRDHSSMDSELRACRDHIAQMQAQLVTSERHAADWKKRQGQYEEAALTLKRDLEQEKVARRSLQVGLDSVNQQHRLLDSQLTTAQLKARNLAKENRDLNTALEVASAEAERLRGELGGAGEERGRLGAQLAEVTEQYEQLLQQRAEAGGAVEALTAELQKTRTKLKAARLEREKCALHATNCEQESAELRKQLALRGDELQQQRETQRSHLDAVLGKIDQAEKKAVKLQMDYASKFHQVSQRTGHSHSSNMEDANCMETEVLHLRTRIEQFDADLHGLQHAIDHRQRGFTNALDQHERARSREKEDLSSQLRQLQSRLREASDTLSGEKDARSISEKVAQRLRKELEDLRQSSEDRLEAEMQRVRAELEQADQYMRDLKKCSEDEKRASQELLRQERELHGGALEKARAAAAAVEAELAQLQPRLLQASTDAANLKVALEGERGRAADSAEQDRAAHEVLCAISKDLATVARHVTKMQSAAGIAKTKDMPEVLFTDASCAGGDRTPAQLLHLAAKELRGLFAAHTEQVQDLASRNLAVARPPAPAAPKRLMDEAKVDKERELRATVSKLLHTEEALESSFSCMACMSIFTSPVMCVPCGHNYCMECIQQTQVPDGEEGQGQYKCAECDKLTTYVENDILDTLCSKYEYKLAALRSLNKICVVDLQS